MSQYYLLQNFPALTIYSVVEMLRCWCHWTPNCFQPTSQSSKTRKEKGRPPFAPQLWTSPLLWLPGGSSFSDDIVFCNFNSDHEYNSRRPIRSIMGSNTERNRFKIVVLGYMNFRYSFGKSIYISYKDWLTQHKVAPSRIKIKQFQHAVIWWESFYRTQVLQ